MLLMEGAIKHGVKRIRLHVLSGKQGDWFSSQDRQECLHAGSEPHLPARAVW